MHFLLKDKKELCNQADYTNIAAVFFVWDIKKYNKNINKKHLREKVKNGY